MTDPHTTLTGAAAADPRAAMREVDLSGSERVPVLLDLVAAMSEATDPGTVLRAYSRGIRRILGRIAYISLSTRGLADGEYRITRQITQPDAPHIDTENVWPLAVHKPVHTGGFLGTIIRNGRPVAYEHLDVTDDPVLGDTLAPFRSMMAIPLFDNGKPLNWAIMLKEEPEGFTVSSIEESIMRANLIGGRVKSTVVAAELLEAQRTINHEVKQIARIQQALLPARMPMVKGVELAAHYETFDRAGGDYYDIVPLDGCAEDLRASSQCIHTRADGEWGIFMGDAAGHGPAAAVIMAILHTLLHSFPQRPENPGDVLAHMNDHLTRKQLGSTFATAFFAIYDAKTRIFRYARAGHPPPLLKNPGSGGRVTRLEGHGGIPLGIAPETYEIDEVQLEPGQSVVMYTDGITEAKNPHGRMFGIEGIERALTKCTGEPDCVMGSIMTAVRDYEAGARPEDDQTLLALKVVE